MTKTIKGYVGMTKEQYENLLIKGGKGESSWSVSDGDNCIYFWNLEKIKEMEYENDDDYEASIDYAKQQAMWSGLTNVANFKSDYLVILTLSIPENLIDDDDSCENMDEASCIHINDFDNKFIIEAEQAEVSTMLYPYILCGVTENKYFQLHNNDYLLSKLIEAVKDSDTLCDIIDNGYYLDFEKLDTTLTLAEAV